MKSTFVWLILAGAVLLFSDSVAAWNRQVFNRYSRNLFRNGNIGVDVAFPATNEINEFNTLFGLGNEAGSIAGAGGNMLLDGAEQQQTEVYGIVEPLEPLEPCVDRPCQANDDCCPTGVCVNTYGGEGKCDYVYGRKRDLCHRNAECETGMSCLKGVAGNWVCQPTPLAAATPPQFRLLSTAGVNGIGVKTVESKQFGEDCVSSSDCNVAKGVCCQVQRIHHRVLPKKMCAYIRDPFMCIDIMPTEDQETRESRFLSSFRHTRM